MERCAGYLFELAEIYGLGATDNRHILGDLKKIERRARCTTQNDPSFRPLVRSDAILIRWVDDVEQALRILGGLAHLSEIELVVRKLRLDGGRSWPRHADACIRDILERHCSESMKYMHESNLFEMEERGSGYWRLRDGKVTT
jgi:hypothetical protein